MRSISRIIPHLLSAVLCFVPVSRASEVVCSNQLGGLILMQIKDARDKVTQTTAALPSAPGSPRQTFKFDRMAAELGEMAACAERCFRCKRGIRAFSEIYNNWARMLEPDFKFPQIELPEGFTDDQVHRAGAGGLSKILYGADRHYFERANIRALRNVRRGMLRDEVRHLSKGREYPPQESFRSGFAFAVDERRSRTFVIPGWQPAPDRAFDFFTGEDGIFYVAYEDGRAVEWREFPPDPA